jgi:exosortase
LRKLSKESGMSVSATKYIWRALPIVVAISFAYATVLVKLSRDWWTDENYSHGLLIPFIIGYIVWIQRDKLASADVKPSTLWGSAAVVFALFALWAGVAGAELYTQRMSLILILAGTILYFWGGQLLKLLWVPLALLFLAMPIPTIIFNKIAFPLQLFASKCAVWSMRTWGIPVLRQGNVIELKPLNSFQTKKLEVVEACSGIRSLMTLITLAVVFAYFTHPSGKGTEASKSPLGFLKSYGFWRSSILVLSAVPIAILTNALRVSGTGVLAHYYGTEVADGFFHSFSGWAIYVVAFVMLFGVGWVLDRFKPKSMSANKEKDDSVRENVVARVVPAEGAE